MTKQQMIEYLVKTWIRNAQTENERKSRFITLDSVKNKLNRNWTKEGIKWAYDLYVCEGWSIDMVIEKFYELTY